MNRFLVVLAASVVSIGGTADRAHAQLTVIRQFNPGSGSLVSAAFERVNDRVWVYGSFTTNLESYTRTGAPVSTLVQPGESANDFDLSFTATAFTLGTTSVPIGSLLAINGETGTADIYALNPDTGVTIATLTTAFGASHVVGGAYHPGRGTFFLVQDSVPGGPNANRIAEVSPVTGAVLNTFGTGDGNYTIFFGDLEVHPDTGNLYLVSSDESSIRELTASGEFVRDLALPSGVSDVSGLGFDDLRGEIWVSGTDGVVTQLGGFVPVPEPAWVLVVGATVVGARGAWRRFRCGRRSECGPAHNLQLGIKRPS